MSRLNTGLLGAVAALVALTGVLAGCVPQSVPQSTDPEPIVVITGARGLTLDPYSPRLADRRVGRLLFRGLFTVGPDGMPAPDVAAEVPTVANGGIRNGGRSVVYRIRKGLEWHDGTPLTARDVAFTIRLLVDGRLTDDPGEDFRVVKDARAVDDETVVVTLSRADSVLAWRLAPYVLPEHLLASSPDIPNDPYWRDPVGSGPYRAVAVGADGTVELSPAAEGPDLVIKPYDTESEAMRAFNDADRVVWLNAVGSPAGGAESLSSTWGPVWRSIVFYVGPDSQWTDASMRRGIAVMTTTSIPPSMPSWAYPFGIRPPERSVADTRAADAAFKRAGYRWVSRGGYLGKDGKRLDLYVGVPSIRAEEERRFSGVARVWMTTGMNAGFTALSVPVRQTWPEGGTRSRPTGSRAFMLPMPAGRPWGWAWPYKRGDQPSWKRPWGLNDSHLSDARVQAAFEAARTAPDPEAARSHIAEAGRLIYGLSVQIDIEPVPERVLYKGVTGVEAWPSPDEALSQAVLWRMTASSEASAAR